MNKYELVDVKFIGMFHFQMYEGKFLDLGQKNVMNTDMYVYANISDFGTESFEDSDVRVYAHSYEELFDASAYELSAVFDEETLESMKQKILKKVEERSNGYGNFRDCL